MSKINESMRNEGGGGRERGREKETKPRRTWAIAFSDLSQKLRYSRYRYYTAYSIHHRIVSKASWF